LRESVLGRTPWAPGAPALADAARAIASVASEGRSADVALAPFEGSPAGRRAAIRAITLGSLRWYLRLAPAVDLLLARPKRLAPEVHALLVAGAHQIEYSRNAPEVTVHASVDAARILKEVRGTGLVNAVLRRFVGERHNLLSRVDESVPGRTAHPSWLVKRLAEAWPEQLCTRFLEANNAHPPMVLRLDLSRRTRDEYLSDLQAAGIVAYAISWAPAAIRLEEPVQVSDLPGFAEGLVSVQDAGAQLAAVWLGTQPGMRVLDACAAPGGKTGHLLEHTPGLGELVAVDIDARRVERIAENLRRLRRVATVAVADVRQPTSFWDGRPFHRILVDAPCSSTGVIRRHPDIKLLRRMDDIPALTAAQLEILRASFAMLAPGGRLLYCTCSVLPDENQAVIDRFLRSEPHARPIPVAAELVPGARAAGSGIQLVPGSEAGTDGFYYACLEKTTAGT
jgi:16S rRNA (cytosine967-C5)-methyltransferase